jgi:hypothetical protein
MYPAARSMRAGAATRRGCFALTECPERGPRDSVRPVRDLDCLDQAKEFVHAGRLSPAWRRRPFACHRTKRGVAATGTPNGDGVHGRPQIEPTLSRDMAEGAHSVLHGPLSFHHRERGTRDVLQVHHRLQRVLLEPIRSRPSAVAPSRVLLCGWCCGCRPRSSMFVPARATRRGEARFLVPRRHGRRGEEDEDSPHAVRIAPVVAGVYYRSPAIARSGGTAPGLRSGGIALVDVEVRRLPRWRRRSAHSGVLGDAFQLLRRRRPSR